ncbi:hypothetical protein ACJMK2_016684 [Sinanodonta woodiana]|uniref:Homeobox domain-containing protein n=1 Tax=Sinanodonta woodiana TaxID=1069815 RepID=A0ABD3UV77_SINWO
MSFQRTTDHSVANILGFRDRLMLTEFFPRQVWFQNRRARSHKREKEPITRTSSRCNIASTAPQNISNSKQTTPRKSSMFHQNPTVGSFLNCYPVGHYPSLYPHFLPGPTHAMHLEVQNQKYAQSLVRLPSNYGNNHFFGVNPMPQMLTTQSSPEMNNMRLNIAEPFCVDLYDPQDADYNVASAAATSTPKSALKRKRSLTRRFGTASPLPELAMKSENTRLKTPNSDHSFLPSSLPSSCDCSRLNDTPESTISNNSEALNISTEASNNGKGTEEKSSTTGNSDSGIGQDVGD